jgi:hypothetical protein
VFRVEWIVMRVPLLGALLINYDHSRLARICWSNTKTVRRKVIVPPGTPIARYTPGSAADLKVGAKIFIAAAQKQPDGSLTAPNVAVGHADR